VYRHQQKPPIETSSPPSDARLGPDFLPVAFTLPLNSDVIP